MLLWVKPIVNIKNKVTPINLPCFICKNLDIKKYSALNKYEVTPITFIIDSTLEELLV